MRIAVFSTKPYDRTFLDQANQVHQHQLVYLDARLTVETAALASGFSGVCVFVNDKLDREVLQLGRALVIFYGELQHGSYIIQICFGPRRQLQRQSAAELQD